MAMKATRQRGGGVSARAVYTPEARSLRDMEGDVGFRRSSRDWMSEWAGRQLAVSGVIGGVKVA